jgi:hypothetical protein
VWEPEKVYEAKIAALILFGLLGAFLLYIGCRKEKRPGG